MYAPILATDLWVPWSRRPSKEEHLEMRNSFRLLIIIGMLASIIAACCPKTSQTVTPNQTTPNPASQQPIGAEPHGSSKGDRASGALPAIKPGVFQQIPINTQPQRAERNGNVGWVQEVNPGTSTLFSLKLRVISSLLEDHIEIVVIGRNGTIYPLVGDTYHISPISPVNSLVQTPEYRFQDGGSIKVVVMGADKQSTVPPVRVETMVSERSKRNTQIQGVNADWSEVRASGTPEIISFSRSLARLRISNFYCTGFAVSPSLLLTANHCISPITADNQDLCAVTSIVFDYVSDDPNNPGIWASCIKLIASDDDLDYALIQFEPRDKGVSIPALPIAAISNGAQQADILLLHHPRGQVAQFSICKGPLRSVDLANPSEDAISQQRLACGLRSEFLRPTTEQIRSAVTYQCDSAPGSSGSPVLINGAVVGMHFTWDYRYYDSDAELSGSYDDVQCASDQLRLGNWANNVCSILTDATRKSANDAIPTCK
jgi:Trypsin-like peptidase domain